MAEGGDYDYDDDDDDNYSDRKKLLDLKTEEGKTDQGYTNLGLEVIGEMRKTSTHTHFQPTIEEEISFSEGQSKSEKLKVGLRDELRDDCGEIIGQE